MPCLPPSFLSPISSFALLASVELSDVAKRSRSTSGTSNNLGLILWVALAVGLLWFVLHYWSRFRNKFLQQGDSPQSLFLELCHVHRLDRAEKSLLMRAVEAAGLAEPAVAFINPDVLGNAGESQENQALVEKLFGRREST